MIGVIWVVDEKFRDEAYLKRFGENLKRIRMERKLSQEELASKANSILSQVGRTERGVQAPTILTVMRLAKALGVHPKELMDFE